MPGPPSRLARPRGSSAPAETPAASARSPQPPPVRMEQTHGERGSGFLRGVLFLVFLCRAHVLGAVALNKRAEGETGAMKTAADRQAKLQKTNPIRPGFKTKRGALPGPL